MNHKDFDILISNIWEDRRANLRNSFTTATQTLVKVTEINYEKGIADCNKVLGYCFWRFSDYSKSLTCSLKAIDIYKTLGDKKGEADTLNSLGAVYMFQNDNNSRLECNLKCLQLRKEIKDFESVSGSLNNIGETYLEMEDFENAIIWLEKCLNYEYSGADSKAWAFHNLGKIEQVKGDVNRAKVFFSKCLDITFLDKYDVLTCETYLQLCDLFLFEKNFKEAEEYGLKALALGKEIGTKEYVKNAKWMLSSIMEKNGNYLESLNYYKAFHQIHEEIFSEENSQKIKDISYQYKIDKISKEAEIERLKKVELVKAYQKIEQSNLLIEQKNKDITDSIRYAKKIQNALLKPEQHISEHLPEHFILFKPKDIVSGDFYWVFEKEDYLYIAVSDCTGHGVPGAFLTMLGMAFLNEITAVSTVFSPSEILNKLRKKLIAELGKTETRDGMDISLIRIRLSTLDYQWAGALRPLVIFKEDEKEPEIIRGNKQSICFSENQVPFTNHKGNLTKGDNIYLFSDGYVDQFGGKKGKKFKMKALLKLLASLNNKKLSYQKEVLNQTFEDWKGSLEQIDDICVIGVRM